MGIRTKIHELYEEEKQERVSGRFFMLQRAGAQQRPWHGNGASGPGDGDGDDAELRFAVTTGNKEIKCH